MIGVEVKVVTIVGGFVGALPIPVAPCCGAPEGERCLPTCERVAKLRAEATHECKACGWLGVPPDVKDERYRGRCCFCRGEIVPTAEGRMKRRAEIEAVLRDDLRRFPAFAIARRCAILSMVERLEILGKPMGPTEVSAKLFELHRYEAARGGSARPRDEAMRPWLDHEDKPCRSIAAYERARGL